MSLIVPQISIDSTVLYLAHAQIDFGFHFGPPSALSFEVTDKALKPFCLEACMPRQGVLGLLVGLQLLLGGCGASKLGLEPQNEADRSGHTSLTIEDGSLQGYLAAD